MLNSAGLPKQRESKLPITPRMSARLIVVRRCSLALVQPCSPGSRKTVPFQHQTLSSVLSSLTKSLKVQVERLLGNLQGGEGGLPVRPVWDASSSGLSNGSDIF